MGLSKTFYLNAEELEIVARYAKEIDRSESWALRELIQFAAWTRIKNKNLYGQYIKEKKNEQSDC